ncbi:MAG: 4Fe-4S DNA-binding protein [Clostridia bacterium 41_269]|nr:MAG: 4Fe-4S DNA-binding protein [Clostridia bacterium 41_269]
MKILITYYSKTGNTEFAAKKLAEELSRNNNQVELKKIELKRPLGMLKGILYAIMGRKPEILDLGISPADYDVVCIGCPIWAANPHPTFYSFLSQWGSFSEAETVVVFATHRGNRYKEAINKMIQRLKEKGAKKVLFIDFLDKEKEKTVKEIKDFAEKLLSH